MTTTDNATYRKPANRTDVEAAIRLRKAYLKTFTGMHRVQYIDDRLSNNVVTNNHSSFLYQQSWASDWTQILIQR